MRIVGGTNECNICFDESNYFCSDCSQFLCSDCCQRVHRHPSRSHHNPESVDGQLRLSSPQEESVLESNSNLPEDEFSMQLSPSAEQSFIDAELIATLADRFKLTKFQKEIIQATLSGNDTLVLHPTGSGKSLCFQFPPVYLYKKAIIVTPTISLMQDQVEKMNELGIPSTYLGSAQFDVHAEARALDPTSSETLIFVTPEWITKASNQQKVLALSKARKLALIAIDEAHLISEWANLGLPLLDFTN